MKYFTSVAVGSAAAVVAAVLYTLVSSSISYRELGWGGYWAFDVETLPRFFAVLLLAFAGGFFWKLRREAS
jgi:cytochrome c biogenesis factor